MVIKKEKEKRIKVAMVNSMRNFNTNYNGVDYDYTITSCSTS
jgi:hypothetical protein